MSGNQIETLQKHSREILLSEIGALIHDIGKLNKFFVEKQSVEKENEYRHGNILEYESKEDSKFPALAESPQNKSIKLKGILEDIKVSYNDEQSNLHLFLKDHHKKDNDKPIDGFVQLLKASDKFDSDEDRGNAFDKQSICATYQSNAFGFEKEIDLLLYENERSKVYDLIIDLLDDCDMDNIKKKRENFLKNLKESFNKALGMTARAANDVTLWEHSYMTASIMKALFAENILSGKNFIVKPKKEIKEGKHFKILSIGWDYFDFLSQSQRIPDIIGRTEALNGIKELIKNKIEVEYVLGNCIYEDASSIHFLIPASIKEDDLIKKEVYKIFNEKLEGIVIPHILFSEKGGSLVDLMPKSIQNLKKEIIIKQVPPDFKSRWIETWENSSHKKKLICSNCGKGFYCEGDPEKNCNICKALRKKGRKEAFPQTQFIDEIAWNGNDYENVTLFILNFNLEKWLNGDYINSTFIKNPEKDYNDLKWKDGKKLSGVSGLIGKELKGNFEKNEENIEAILKIVSGKLDKLSVKKGNSTDNILKSVNSLIEKETSLKIFVTDNKYMQDCFEFSYLDENKLFKNPSPSRLMRVWNNTEEFFRDLEKEICQNVPSIRRYVLEGVKHNDSSRKAWEVELSVKEDKTTGEVVFEGENCITVTPHLNSFIGKNENSTFKIKVIDEEWEKKTNTFNLSFDNKIKFFRAYRIITVSPDQFIFLAPAFSSLEILNGIKTKYMELFGKVFGKLPLNMGVVYFQKNTPLFSVLDSARRFTKNFEDEHNIFDKNEIPSFEVKDVSENEIIFNKEYKVKKSSKLGNCEIDCYHPYLLVENENDEDIIEIAIDNETIDNEIITQIITQKHVESIKKGDKIRIHPSFFDFEFLDTNGRRFDIVLNEKTENWKKRKHPIIGANGPRPYFLNDLYKFERLKELFETIGSWTPIRDLESLTIAKRQEWGVNDGEDSVYENIVNSALENKISRFFKDEGNWKNNIKPFLLRCILEGSFFDAIELYKSIMKIDLKVKE
jgi:CRISPR-associated Csx11 family protein